MVHVKGTERRVSLTAAYRKLSFRFFAFSIPHVLSFTVHIYFSVLCM